MRPTLPLVALGLASPAWACPELATLTCGDRVTVTNVWYDASDYDSQCADPDLTWDGGDFTLELSVPAGRPFYVDAFISDYQCFTAGCTGQVPDIDLFLYDRDNCVDWTNQVCIDQSLNLDLEADHVDWVSNGGLYQAAIDEFYGIYGDYDYYDAVVSLSCPVACNPNLATEITCSDDLNDQPAGATDVLDYYTCGDPFTHLQQGRRETIYSFTPQATGPVRFNLDGMTHDFDIYVLEDLCDQTACIESSTQAQTLADEVEFDAVVGHTYFIVVEAYAAAAESGTYDLSFDTTAAGGCREDCDDTVDNDGDGLNNCLDPDCCVDPICGLSDLCCPDEDGDGERSYECGGGDCDDRPGPGAAINPDATEICNGRDDDCDGVTDEGTSCYDDDGDGFTEQGGDCDDANASRRPGGTEVRNGADDDCDGRIDDGTTAYDDDGDCACEVAPCVGSMNPACGALVGGDCRDGDTRVGPAVAEIDQNGIDDDCDGSVDGGIYDPDGDGTTAEGGDCDDADGATFPGATEIPDRIDNDCDGTIDEGTAAYDDDGDGACEGIDLGSDGHPDCADGSVPGDCGDHDAAIGPQATEIDGNGIDDDCDGVVDEGGTASDDDGDGLSEDEGDCDDSDPAVHPGAAEVGNDVDDDCDGQIDEGTRDVDGDGVTVEQGDCDDEHGWVRPGLLEVCDGIDNDCDGEIDEDCTDAPGGPARDPEGCGGCATGGPPVGWVAGLLLLAIRRRALAVVPLLAACSNDVEVNPLAATLSVAEELIDLGDVPVGTSVLGTVTVVHEGGSTAQVDAVDVFNIEGDAFSAGSVLPLVPIDGSAAVDFLYEPDAPGWHQAVLTVMTDADLTPELQVHVRAHAVATDLSVWPLLVDFGPVAPGDIATRVVTLSNSGLVDVAIGSASLYHPRFAVLTSLPLTIPAGQTATLEVAFSPADGLTATDALGLAPDIGQVPPVELFGNACGLGLPDLYDADDDGWTACDGDCDDADADAHPGGVEVLDGDDENCDGRTDEGTAAWDDDGDCACEAPPCLGSNNGLCTLSTEADCADGATAIGPHAVEDLDNGIDDDCDGVVDQGTTDLDADGYAPAGGDCDDLDPTRYPGAPELPDGKDNDCDTTVDEGTVRYDDDGDGYCEQAPCTLGPLGGGDCDDRPSFGVAAHPGAAEVINGRDDDCDGKVDEGTAASDDDGDGFSENAGDCDDGDAAIYPGAGGC